MASIVFDIETVGEDFQELDATAQEFFLKAAETKAEEKIKTRRSPLHPEVFA